jgi:HAE1 family hydrophobic/amphiphilic exporter-1
MSISELSWFVDDTISRALQGEKGVAQVARVGGVDREINIVIDPDRMAAAGLTAPQLNNALANFSVDAPGGRVSIGDREQTVRVLGRRPYGGRAARPDHPHHGRPLRALTDVAEVGDGAGEPRGFARLDGQPVVAFQVSKTKDASDVASRTASRIAIEKLRRPTPA